MKLRNFGLILFVYTIGLQVGPGFVSSLRREGLPLNLMAASVVLLPENTPCSTGLTLVSKPPKPTPNCHGLE